MIEPHALGVDRKDFKGDKFGFAGYRIAQTMDAASTDVKLKASFYF